MNSTLGQTNRVGKLLAVFWVVLLGTFANAQSAGDAGRAVLATHPLAYYRLEAAQGNSETGSTQYHLTAGARSSPGGISAGKEGHFALMDGRSGMVDTTQIGGIQSSASLMAWVRLGSLPSAERRILYVAGESQNGNDFDLQFEPDNKLKFYNGTGGPIEISPKPESLVGNWHMIVATVNGATGKRAIYWDGVPAASDENGKGMKAKTTELSIGNSKVFGDRFFPGGIDDVALWNSTLEAADVKAIFAAAKTSGVAAESGLLLAPTCSHAPSANKNAKLPTLPAHLAFLSGYENITKIEAEDWSEEHFPPSPWGDGNNPKRGKHWQINGVMASDCKEKNLATETLKSGFLVAGWTTVATFNTQPQMTTMRYAKGGVEAWVNIGVGEPPNTGMSVIEVAPLPISLTLATPATMPEKVTPEKGDFPYLTPIAGSKFKGGHLDPAPYTVMLTGANQPEIVATGMINKNYQPPEGISNLEFLTVYHDALLKAGWSIVNEFNSSDVAISAHYGLNGRNIWAYLHFTTSGYVLNVADASAGDDLAADLSKECHVALTGVLFDFNKSTLKPESDAILEKVSNLLVKNPSLKLEVQGHTDNVGGDTYNQTLSESRAAAVVDWLKRHGADGVRLSAKGYGKSKPIADNGNELGRAKNRRVEIVNPTCATKK